MLFESCLQRFWGGFLLVSYSTGKQLFSEHTEPIIDSRENNCAAAGGKIAQHQIPRTILTFSRDNRKSFFVILVE
uniref:Putative secreted protein n=1 Tax=Anopheles darlingi TaxID=43151 RepID=A0A2M4DC14_ANODA